jgi:ABC-type antimicrobial peptide transport system permease subunit
VGVVHDVKYRGVDQPSLDIYEPAAQGPSPASYLVVRAEGAPLALVSSIASAARALDHDAVVDRVTTLDAVVGRVLAPWRLSAWVFGCFAAVASGLAGVGLFVLISLEVASRRREFAIRTALGALPRHIVPLALSTAGRYAAAGAGVGVALAVVSTRALQGLLYGIEPLDLATYFMASAVVVAIIVVASYAPLRRAVRTDPAILLRDEL